MEIGDWEILADFEVVSAPDNEREAMRQVRSGEVAEADRAMYLTKQVADDLGKIFSFVPVEAGA